MIKDFFENISSRLDNENEMNNENQENENSKENGNVMKVFEKMMSGR